MHTVDLLLYVVAFVLLVLAALGVPSPRVSLLALGLAAWVLVPLLDTVHAIGG